MKSIEKYLLISILSIYSIILLSYSNKQSFWHDEIYTLTFLKGISAYDFEGANLYTTKDEFLIQSCKEEYGKDNFISNFPLQIQHEGHPPLYFLSLKSWSLIFGYSELALRSFSIFCGIGFFLILFYFFRKKFNNNIAWKVLMFAIFNPFLFYFFTESRMYALALFFALVSFYNWSYLTDEKKIFSKKDLLFIFSAIALLYTHYYGVFFLLTLAVIDMLKNKLSIRIFLYIIPFIFFMPWLWVIKLQLAFHSVHWTDGAYSFSKSFISFLDGGIELMFSPVSKVNWHEYAIGLLISIILLYYAGKNKKQRNIISISLLIYFAQVYLFDLILNHHTIAVPRYYIFLIIFFFWIIAKTINNISPRFANLLLLTYIVVSSFSLISIYSTKRSPKQMFRELSAYIDINYDDENTVIVLLQKGPLVWGLANYISGNYSIIYKEDLVDKKDNKKYIYVEEDLGLSYLKKSNKSLWKDNKKVVPFVGLNIYE